MSIAFLAGAAGPVVAGSPRAPSSPGATLELGSGPSRFLSGGVFDSAEMLRSATFQEAPRGVAPEAEFKDGRKAMLYSLLLPGLGEYWLGHRTRAQIFFATEAGIWTAFGVFRVQGGNRKDRYREWASVFAGTPERDNDEYYRVLANYISSEGPFSANETVRRQARALYPDDREAQDAYLLANGHFGDDAWEWESEEAFDRYKQIRKSSLDSYDNASLTLGLLVANRLLSVLDAGLLASRHNRGGATDGSLSWGVGAGVDGPNATVVLARDF
jgi:hypothetical protein